MGQYEVIIALLAAAVTLKVPFLGKILSVLNTMVHESGHAAASLLTSGRVVRIHLYPNTEGVAVTAHRGWSGKVLTTLAGYPFSSFLALGMFYCMEKQWNEWIFYGVTGLAAANLLLWVRNAYGVIWLLALGGGLAVVYGAHNASLTHDAVLSLASLLLIDSIFSAATIAKLSWKTPKAAGDASNLAAYTRVPAAVWGALFFGQSLFCLYLTARIVYH